MHYVYMRQSENDPAQYYDGLTTAPQRRLDDHNSGKSIHTNKFKLGRLSAWIEPEPMPLSAPVQREIFLEQALFGGGLHGMAAAGNGVKFPGLTGRPFVIVGSLRFV